MAAKPSPILLLSLVFLLSSSSTPSHSFQFSNYHTLLSLSHSLACRVATLRATRGDLEGAARAQTLARNLERGTGLGFYKFALNVGWDYVKNYAWRGGSTFSSFQTLGGAVSDLNKLLRYLAELNRLSSGAERLAWFSRNYESALRVSKSLFSRLLDNFRQPGPLRDVVLTLQKEVLEGDLLRDCLELGSDDLKGLLQVLKDIADQYSPGSPNTEL